MRERESVIRRYQQDRGPEGEHNNMPCSIMHMYILQNYILYTSTVHRTDIPHLFMLHPQLATNVKYTI